MTRTVHGRTVALLVVLDLLTYALVYWLVVPAFAPVTAVLPPLVVAAGAHVLVAVRLVFLGLVAARSMRSRVGLERRSDAVVTVLVGAVVGWAVHLVAGVAVHVAAGLPAVSWWTAVALVEWVVFASLGALAATPGPPDRALPLRYRGGLVAADRGSVNIALVPAVAGLLALTFLLLEVAGSATDDHRGATTAADAAALAAGQAWEDGLRGPYAALGSAGTPAAFWRLAGRDLGHADFTAGMVARASELAERNGAELVDLRVDPLRARVTVRVRYHDRVPRTGERVESTATAELRFRSGLCRQGRTLGYLMGAVCRTGEPPAPPAAVEETPPETEDPEAPAPEPPPFEPPALGLLRTDVVLVHG